jgi:hypothetical protein
MSEPDEYSPESTIHSKVNSIKTYEFDEICESQKFNHDHLFVNYSDHREEINAAMARKAVCQSRLIHALQENESLKRELEIVKAQLASARSMYEHATYLEPNSYMRKAHLKEYDLCLDKIRKEMSK